MTKKADKKLFAIMDELERLNDPSGEQLMSLIGDLAKEQLERMITLYSNRMEMQRVSIEAMQYYLRSKDQSN
jgi:hypothetical protein